MKRIITLIIAVLLSVSVFNACTFNHSEQEMLEQIGELPNEYFEFPIVPRIMSKERVENVILASIENTEDADRIMNFYTLYDIEGSGISEALAEEMIVKYPACEKRAVYICEPDIAYKELKIIEAIINEYCTDYTHEKMAVDHLICGYTVEDMLNGKIPSEKGSADTDQ